MLFKPIYNLKNRDKISYKNLSFHCNLNHIFYLIDEIANDLRWDYVSMNKKAIDVIYAYKEKVGTIAATEYEKGGFVNMTKDKKYYKGIF